VSAYLVEWEGDHAWYCSEECSKADSGQRAQIRGGLPELWAGPEEASAAGLVCEWMECPRGWEEL
jgi:hypothetical protein